MARPASMGTEMGETMRTLLSRMTLMARFTISGLVVTVLIGLTLGWALGHELEESALDQEAASAAEQLTFFEPILQRDDFAGPLPPGRLQLIDQLVHQRILSEHTARVKLWSPSGLVVYSSDPQEVGREFPISDELDAALDGHVAKEVSDLGKAENVDERGRYDRLLEVYVPLRLGGSQVVGVYELYRDLAAVEPSIASMQRLLWLSLALALSVLYLVLFGIVHRASRDLVRQTGENARLQIEASQVNALQQLNEMKSELVSTVSHEIRSPLTALQGYSELLLTRDPGPAERHAWLSEIHRESGRLARFINDLLDLSRLDQGRAQLELAPVHVDEVVDDRVTLLQMQDGVHQIDVDCRTGVPPVLADRDRVVRVVDNLLSNALKYSPAGSVVRVLTEAREGGLWTHVRDEGHGIAADDVSRVFEPFYRVRNAQVQHVRGTGLGLAITRASVEQMGGRLEVQSIVGEGSTFSFWLPFAPLTSPVPVY